MTWLSRVLNAPEGKASAAARLLMLNGSPVKWTPRDYKSFSKEAYQTNVVAYQCINMIGEAVASVEWGAWKGDTELDKHPLLDLLKRPNPLQSYSEYMKAYIGFMQLSGNAYAEAVDLQGVDRELHVLRPDRMNIVASDTGIPRAFEYKVGGSKHVWEVDQTTGMSDVNHYKLFNPLDDWYGMSPVEAGAFAVDQHNQSMTWMQSLLQNSARPSGALVTSADSDLTDEQFRRLQAQIEEQYTGAKNAGRPMLLEGGLDWKQMGFGPKDMATLETKYSAARDICLAFGVPPLLMGIKGDNTFSNYKEARLAFWEDTIIPLLMSIKGGLFYWLELRAGGDVDLRPNLDSIPAIAEKRAGVWEMANASTDLTINERRELKGYAEVSGGDVVLVSATQVPLGTSVDLDEDDGIDELDAKMLAKIAGYDTKTS